MKTLAVIGAGHLGQQIAYYALSDNHYDKVVFFDDFIDEDHILDYKVLGKTKSIQEAYNRSEFDEMILGIGYKHLKVRKKIFENYRGTIPFGNIIHRESWLDPTVKLGVGNVIYPGCLVDQGSIIDDNIIMNVNCTVAHDTQINSHCFLSPRVAIAGFVRIGEQCILGINSTIIDNIKINSSVQLGGGTVVIDDLKQSGLYVGNPARFVR